jgi:hypothetical protein
MIKKIKLIRDYLSVFWGFSIVYRIFGKVTGLYEVPKWLGLIIFIIIMTVILLSARIYFIERKNKKT